MKDYKLSEIKAFCVIRQTCEDCPAVPFCRGAIAEPPSAWEIRRSFPPFPPLEEDGECIKTPFKVGDVVYFVHNGIILNDVVIHMRYDVDYHAPTGRWLVRLMMSANILRNAKRLFKTPEEAAKSLI